MRLVSALVIFASLAWSAPATHAESRNPADYPLRIHIYRRNAAASRAIAFARSAMAVWRHSWKPRAALASDASNSAAF
jgi:hypothetical protein